MRAQARILLGFAAFSLLLRTGGAAQEYIAYAVGGASANIHIHDVATGETAVLTGFGDTGTVGSISAADDGTLVFTRPSPDNGRPNRTIWAVRPDGSGLIDLVKGDAGLDFAYAAVSADGTKIAYTVNSAAQPGVYQLWVRNFDGSGKRQLTFFSAPVPPVCSYPIFISATQILFKTTIGSLEDYYRVATDGTALVNITDYSSATLYYPRIGRPLLNAARSRVIYARQDQNTAVFTDWRIYTRDLASGTETLLPYNPQLYYGSIPTAAQADPAPSYVGDAQAVLAATQDGAVYDLYLNQLAGNPYAMRLTVAANPALPYYFAPSARPTRYAYVDDGVVTLYEAGVRSQLAAGTLPSFDRRGNRIAYANAGVWIMTDDGGNQRLMDADPTASHPCFSPDGRWIAYVKGSEIWARLTDLSNSPVQLTASPASAKADPVFAPDSRAIYFTGTVNGARHVFRLPVAVTYNLTPLGIIPLIAPTALPADLTPQPAESWQPTVAADGTAVVFVTTRSQMPELWRMNPDGSGQRKIYFGGTQPLNPFSPRFSPQDAAMLSFASGTPSLVRSTDLSDDLPTAGLVTPVIATTQRFSWGRKSSGTVDVVRSLLFSTADPAIPLRYPLTVQINRSSVPTGLIVEETVPETWVLTSVLVNGTPETGGVITVSGGRQTIKWSLGLAGLAPAEDAVIDLTFDISGDTPGRTYYLTGGATVSQGKYLTSGGTRVTIAGPAPADYPVLPADADGDWQISDEELLAAIDAWALAAQIDGWPLDVADWDYWLLQMVDFWANAAGYGYDAAAAFAAQQERWKKI